MQCCKCGPDGLCSRLFRFIYGHNEIEQLFIAVEGLIKAVMFEAMIRDYPLRYRIPLTYPFEAPHNTPEELNWKNFYYFRDDLLFGRVDKTQRRSNIQEYFHNEMILSETYALARKYALIWMKKVGIKSTLAPEDRDKNPELENEKRRSVVAAVSDILKQVTRISKSISRIDSDKENVDATPPKDKRSSLGLKKKHVRIATGNSEENVAEDAKMETLTKQHSVSRSVSFASSDSFHTAHSEVIQSFEDMTDSKSLTNLQSTSETEKLHRQESKEQIKKEEGTSRHP